MSKSLFYRIEKNGRGPYYLAMITHDKWNSWYYSCQNKHPLPQNDEILKHFWTSLHWTHQDSYLFGFKDIDQLRRWFDIEEHLLALHESGFSLKVYEVDSHHFHEGSTQCIAHCHGFDQENPMKSISLFIIDLRKKYEKSNQGT